MKIDSPRVTEPIAAAAAASLGENHGLGQTDLSAAARQVAARILYRERNLRRLADLLGQHGEDLLTALDLMPTRSAWPELIEADDTAFRAFAMSLRRYLQPLATAAQLRANPFDDNIDTMASVLGLDRHEQAVLRLGALLRLHPLLRELFDCGRYNHSNWERRALVGHLLGIDGGRLTQLFGKRSRLVQLGLMEPNDLDFWFSEQFAQDLDLPGFNPDVLLSHRLRRSVPAGLRQADFSHLPEMPRLLRHLQRSLTQGHHGVNVLIYGPPGTGKTELVRMLAAELDAILWEVPVADDDGDMAGGNYRLGAYTLAQNLLAEDERHLLLFDEIEDVFGSGRGGLAELFSNRSRRSTSKGWVNEKLEGNRVPTFWLSNDIHGLDSAYLRRFDQIIELGAPGRRVRERIVERYLGGELVSAACRERIAGIEDVPPAQLERTARVLAGMADDPQPERDQAALALLESSLRAMGVVRRLPKAVLPGHYDPAVLNADGDLDELVEMLADGKGGRLLLWGPPGTGKSAFAHYLGRRLDRPVLVRRASDLLDCFLGGTEENIAKAFQQAIEDDAVLLIDEADSFLRDRGQARHSWEVTQVNEMLTQIEQFDGTLVAATNLVDELDAASLRRFDFKLRFDSLRPGQRRVLFERLCADLDAAGADADMAAALARLDRLDQLTPGDFANVRRQLERRPRATSAGEIVDRLASEVAMKSSQQRAIGFYH